MSISSIRAMIVLPLTLGPFLNSMIIYKATNLVNGKIYIGKTVVRLYERKSKHLYDAYKSKRDFNSAFHNAIRKYGIEKFDWKIINKSLFPDLLLEMEKYYIKKFNSKNPNGYNLTDGGEGATGYVCSEITKEKLRNANLGKKASLETCRKLSESMKEVYRNGRVPYFKGKCLSIETKEKMSKARGGDKAYFWGKFGKDHPKFGRHISEEAKKKIGDGHRGGKSVNFGKRMSKEICQKKSIAMKKYWEVKHAANL